MARRIDRLETVSTLRAAMPAVLPSLLFCDFGRLRDEIEAAEAAGAAAMHLDVMDGHFVPNLTYGMLIVEAARAATELPIDVHLMIDNPLQYIDDFRAAGADNMTVHVEALPDPRPALDRIHELGASAGLAFNPPTPLAAIESGLPHCDLVLVMSVMPGFGGQKFDPVALEKLRKLRDRSDVDPLLEVDGGIDIDTIGACAHAGAGVFVAGSAIFRHDDYASAIGQLQVTART